MKRNFVIAILIVFYSLFFSVLSNAQTQPVTFDVEVASDSILMDNYFQVRFTIENGKGENFEAPDFSESFDIVSGPNYSTSMTTMNGTMTQSMAITYYLRPHDIGLYYIQPASVMVEGAILETAPLEIFVHPNPDGIQQSPPILDGFQMEFANPFGMESPFGDLFKEFEMQTMPFDMEEFFKNLDTDSMPLDMSEFFQGFSEEMPNDMMEWFNQFDMTLPELDSVEPQQKENEAAPKKQRKTTRI
jgi:hypothetical protein